MPSRRHSFVANKNFFVPHLLTRAEAQRRTEAFAKANEIGKKIEAAEATPEEIEDFFGFRARIRGYRGQLLKYEHARAGGRISEHDPVLDREEIRDPEILARYDELERATKEDYAQEQAALRAIGLGEQ